MKASLEDISPVKKKLLVEIESQEVERKLNEAYRDLGKKAKIPGFRTGKIPRNILEKHFSLQVGEDVTRSLINETFPKAVDEVKAFPLGPPSLEKNIVKQGQNFSYTAVMEVRPQFEVENYLGIEVEKEKFSVTEEKYQDQIEQIRKSNGRLVSIEEKRPIKKDDYVALSYECFEDDRAIEGVNVENSLIHVGSNGFHLKFEEALINHNKDEKVDITVDFEDEYFNSNFAGKHVNFKVYILDLKEMILPELNDDFAKTLNAGFDCLDDLKSKVKETLKTQEEKRIETEMRMRLLKKISDSLDFELPQVLVEGEIDYALDNFKQGLLRNGSNFETAGLSEAKVRHDFRPGAEKRVKDMLILDKIADKEKVTITEEDLEKGYKDLSSSMGQPPEIIKKYYEGRQLVDFLEEKLLEEKTLNYLVEHAILLKVEKDTLSQDVSQAKENK